MRDEQGEKRNEIVRFRNCETEFFQKSFEVLFSGLLAVKALFVMKWFGASCDGGGQPEVAFGFANPLPRCSFHREPCPWS